MRLFGCLGILMSVIARSMSMSALVVLSNKNFNVCLVGVKVGHLRKMCSSFSCVSVLYCKVYIVSVFACLVFSSV